MILVLTTYRTGSTYFCKTLADENNLENYDEMFHEHLKDHHRANLIQLEKDTNAVVKLMPWHIQNTKIPNLLEKLLSFKPKIYVLIRKDFDQQCQSYYICRFLGPSKDKKINNWHNEFSESKKIILHKEHWLGSVNFLHNQYLQLSDIRDKLPNHELIFTHQLDQSKKYKRPVIWDKKPGYTNIDIEELFV